MALGAKISIFGVTNRGKQKIGSFCISRNGHAPLQADWTLGIDTGQATAANTVAEAGLSLSEKFVLTSRQAYIRIREVGALAGVKWGCSRPGWAGSTANN